MTPSYVYVACVYAYVAVLPSFSTLDLRSGHRKTPTVPPPRSRRAMVVHSPNQFEVQRTAAAAAAVAAANAQGPPDEQVQRPADVLAVSNAAANASAVRSAIEDVSEEADLLGGGQDFDVWTGGVATGRSIEADVHAAGDRINSNVTTRRVNHDNKLPEPTSKAEEDKISVVSDVTPPPPPGSIPQGLNPFTPEWFAQLVGAAASSAASAAASAVASSVRQSNQVPAAAPNSTAPRRLNDRKVPDFWEDRPEFWFEIFDAHLAHFNTSERQSFDTLLPLPTPAARTVVHSVIRTPGVSPYSKSREALLRHFGKTPRQLARELFDTRALGDRLASEYLDHIMGLLPDPRLLFEVMLLDALPANARVAALQHSDPVSMARAADAVLLENRAEAAAASARSSLSLAPAVNSMSLLDTACASGASCQLPLTPTVAAASRGGRPGPGASRKPSADSICANHARFGKDTYKCLAPSSCKMSHIIKPKPPAAASGNSRAGSRQ